MRSKCSTCAAYCWRAAALQVRLQVRARTWAPSFHYRFEYGITACRSFCSGTDHALVDFVADDFTLMVDLHCRKQKAIDLRAQGCKFVESSSAAWERAVGK